MMQVASERPKTNLPFDPARLRRTVLDMAYAGQTVHIGCAFSIIELMAVLYRSHLRFSPSDPAWPERDMMVLSKGHGVMAQYACLREIGWIDDEAVSGYFSDGSVLKGLSDSRVPGLEVTSGSLGHGLSIAVGMALGARRNRSSQRVFSIVGDGEMNEGPIWEAMLFAAQQKLDNLVVIIDENGFQAMGRTDDIVALGDIAEKFKTFGFDAVTINFWDSHLQCQRHRDANNASASFFCHSVNFRGGALALASGERLKQACHWYSFDGSAVEHWGEPFSGPRRSLALYTMGPKRRAIACAIRSAPT